MTPKRKLIVTGAHGFVAGSILSQADNSWEVHALSRGAAKAAPQSVVWHTIAPSDSALAALFARLRPDAVIHTAALADIDYCQRNPGEAREVNTRLTGTIAGLCEKMGTRLVFCSTDTIFGGEHAPYAEDAAPGPVNIYAETKVTAEKEVRDLCPGAAVARLALVVGLPVLGVGNSFLVKLLETLRSGQQVGASRQEVRTPVDVLTAGRALLELAAGNHAGTFHLAGLSRVSRFELAQTIAGHFGFSRELIVPHNADAIPGRAPRPRDVSLGAVRTRSMLGTPFLSLAEGLRLVQEFQCGRTKQNSLR